MRVLPAPPPGVELTPGESVVLGAPPGAGLSLPHGVLIDDHLDAAARRRVDELALEAVRRWRAQFDPLLEIEGIPMGDAWDKWLLRQVALPAVRLRYGLRAAGADPAAAAVIDGEVQPFPFPPEGPRWLRASRALPLPAGPRRGTVTAPHSAVVPVLERLARQGGRRVAVDWRAPPPRDFALPLLRRGAWLPQLGRRALARAERALDDVIRELRAASFDLSLDGIDLGRAMHTGAVAVVEGQGKRLLPRALAAAQAAAAGRLDAALLAFDLAPAERAIVRAVQARGVPALVVHHGYMPVSHFVEGRAADHVGLWTEIERDRFADRDARVVGNPMLSTAVPSVRRDPRHAVVLVQDALQVTARLDDRAPARHLQAAVAAVRQVDPGMRITVRPHPARDASEYQALADGAGADGVDATTPGRELLAGAGLCVGALSTMSLEAALVGTPVVMVDTEGGDWPAPFDGRGDVPYARSADEAAEHIGRVLASGEVEGRQTLLDALGASVPDPVDRVVGWLDEIAR